MAFYNIHYNLQTKILFLIVANRASTDKRRADGQTGGHTGGQTSGQNHTKWITYIRRLLSAVMPPVNINISSTKYL